MLAEIMKRSEYWEELKKDPEQIKRVERLVELEVKHTNKMCTAPFNSLYIGQRNRVSHCCASRYPIGDSSKNSLTEIMHGKEASNIRKDMLNHLYHKHCDSCNCFLFAFSGLPHLLSAVFFASFRKNSCADRLVDPMFHRAEAIPYPNPASFTFFWICRKFSKFWKFLKISKLLKIGENPRKLVN